MNVKAGQMAYIVKSLLGNEGVVVEVVCLCHLRTDLFGEPTWLCRSSSPRMTSDGEMVIEAGVRDRHLRPISGVPVHDEQHDEVSV